MQVIGGDAGEQLLERRLAGDRLDDDHPVVHFNRELVPRLQVRRLEHRFGESNRRAGSPFRQARLYSLHIYQYIFCQYIADPYRRRAAALAISALPPDQLRDMERTAKKENRTMSELVRELYRRYVADQARQEFGRTLKILRAEAASTSAGRLIDREIGAARRARKRKTAR